jgi:hypothetical protein
MKSAVRIVTLVSVLMIASGGRAVSGGQVVKGWC